MTAEEFYVAHLKDLGAFYVPTWSERAVKAGVPAGDLEKLLAEINTKQSDMAKTGHKE